MDMQDLQDSCWPDFKAKSAHRSGGSMVADAYVLPLQKSGTGRLTYYAELTADGRE
jgi:hypothetical protein